MTQIKIDGKIALQDIIVPGDFIKNNMPSSGGEHVKTYLMLLYLVQTRTPFDISVLADMLETTEKDVARSLKHWSDKGLIKLTMEGREITGISFISKEADVPLNGREKIPAEKETASISRSSEITDPLTDEATSNDNDDNVDEKSSSKIEKFVVTPQMFEEIDSDDNFKLLATIVRKYFNREISQMEYELLIQFYYRMGKNLDICEQIIAHCADNKKTTMRAVDKQSIECLESGCNSLDSYKYYLNRKAVAERFIDLLGLSPSRKRLPAEKMKMVDNWYLVYHFSNEMVEEAINRGAIRGGEDPFNYIDKILTNWYDEGITTLEQVRIKDEKHRDEQNRNRQSRRGAPGQPGKTAFNNFEQRSDDYSEEELLFIQNNIDDTTDDQ
jgi:DnaD/phage-associated family protein